jgi:glycine/D-amino acid oxidase-like deaminating enzyme
MLQEWDWKNHYWNQPDILAYLQAVVERHDLGKDIQLNTSIESVVFDDASNSWTVTTSDGETITARYVVCALGLLSKINLPDIKGVRLLSWYPGPHRCLAGGPQGLPSSGSVSSARVRPVLSSSVRPRNSPGT